jgi:mitogen-activated protein kinase 1/3
MSKPDQNASAAERLAGFKVGDQYDLINLIGEGAYGTVW